MKSTYACFSGLAFLLAFCMVTASGCKSLGSQSNSANSMLESSDDQGDGVAHDTLYKEISGKKRHSMAVQLFNVLDNGPRIAAEAFGEDSDFLPPQSRTAEMKIGDDSIVCKMKASDKVYCQLDLRGIKKSDKSFSTAWEPLRSESLASELNTYLNGMKRGSDGGTPLVANDGGIECKLHKDLSRVKCTFKFD